VKKPRGKAQVIKHINEVGIKDIICTTQKEASNVFFCLEIRTKDNHSFFFEQYTEIVPQLEKMEVIYFGESGNGECVAKLGAEFDVKSYEYPV
jgi:hypothetical protein